MMDRNWPKLKEVDPDSVPIPPDAEFDIDHHQACVGGRGLGAGIWGRAMVRDLWGQGGPAGLGEEACGLGFGWGRLGAEACGLGRGRLGAGEGQVRGR